MRWVFTAVCGLSLSTASGGYCSLRCMGFSLQWLLLLWLTSSRHTGFSSCGTQALDGMWDLPGPGLEPVSLALAGGFRTTAPPGVLKFLLFIRKHRMKKKQPGRFIDVELYKLILEMSLGTDSYFQLF